MSEIVVPREIHLIFLELEPSENSTIIKKITNKAVDLSEGCLFEPRMTHVRIVFKFFDESTVSFGISEKEGFERNEYKKFTNHGYKHFIKLKVAPDVFTKAYDFLQKGYDSGKFKYDTRAFERFIPIYNLCVPDISNSYSCSSLVARALQEGGLIPPEINCQYVTPHEIYRRFKHCQRSGIGELDFLRPKYGY